MFYFVSSFVWSKIFAGSFHSQVKYPVCKTVIIKQIRMNILRCLLFTFSLTLSEGGAMKSLTETNKVANIFLYHLANVNIKWKKFHLEVKLFCFSYNNQISEKVADYPLSWSMSWRRNSLTRSKICRLLPAAILNPEISQMAQNRSN